MFDADGGRVVRCHPRAGDPFPALQPTLRPSGLREDGPGPMTTGTMHMGGMTTGAARPGDTCSAHLAYAGTAAPVAHKPWLVTFAKQVSPVFGTDRPTRRPLERFP